MNICHHCGRMRHGCEPHKHSPDREERLEMIKNTRFGDQKKVDSFVGREDAQKELNVMEEESILREWDCGPHLQIQQGREGAQGEGWAGHLDEEVADQMGPGEEGEFPGRAFELGGDKGKGLVLGAPVCKGRSWGRVSIETEKQQPGEEEGQDLPRRPGSVHRAR